MRAYRTITKLYPDSYQGYLYLGLYYAYQAGDHGKAIEMYKKAVDLNPQWFPTYRDLAYSTQNAKGTDATVALLEKFIADYPNAPGSLARQTVREIQGS